MMKQQKNPRTKCYHHTVIADLIPVVEDRRRMAPPPTAVASAPATTPPTPNIVQLEAAEQIDLEGNGVEQAGVPAPSLGVPGPTTPGLESPMDVGMEAEPSTLSEPEAKRARFSTLRVGAETLMHVDEDSSELLQQCGEGDFSFATGDSVESFDIWNDDDSSAGREMTEDDLWQPQSALEPQLDSERLQRIDDFADSVEIDRLLGMKVIQWKNNYNGELGTELSAKFVRSWRKKTRKVFAEDGKLISETPGWLRRSRLVAREFNWLDVRDDVYSPSSSSSVVKILPALALSDGFAPNSVLGTLDVADAFLQVPQPMPRVVKLGSMELVILMCLPGQRDAAKLWYQYFVDTLKTLFKAEVCIEQPCVLKVDNKVAMVLHVDDVLFMGDEGWINSCFLPELEKRFKLSSTVVSRASGGTFEFLKRYHVVDAGYTQITVYPEAKHVCAMYEKFAEANGRPAKLAKTPCSPGNPANDPKLDELLPQKMAEVFRSLVGIAMYVSQERFDLQYTTKTLASSLKQPTRRAWCDLARLVGYMKYSENFALRMKKTQRGSTFQQVLHGGESESENDLNCIETYTDSDWSGRSTSSAVHSINGLVVWSTSRTQKCVSLSSTEAEWYAATSAACDSLFLHHVISFLTNQNVKPITLHTDNAAVRMLSKKLGAGRLRHIHGRLLWLQEKTGSSEMILKQVKTNYNLADLNTKSLNRDRFNSLLFLLGFVVDDEPIGEHEFSRMESKELLKQQVKMIRETMDTGIDNVSCSKSNRFAKQFLRVLSIYSLVGMADGFSLRGIASRTFEALGQWHDALSPIHALIFTVFFVMAMLYVVFMFPGSGMSRSRSRSNDGDIEPGSEPPPSRYPMNPRSLGARYPGLFESRTFRPEGILYWMFDRCHKRVVRGNRMMTNNERKSGLQDMLKLCVRGLSADEQRNMADNLASLTDLTDDEFSPRAHLTESMVIQQCAQGAVAFDIAANQVRQMREAELDSDGEQIESAEGRFARYQQSTVSEVSDPAYWHDVHGEQSSERDVGDENESNENEPEGEAATDPSDSDGPETIEEKRHRYSFLERHEVSDGELWQQWHDEAMMRVNGEQLLQASHRLDFREYLEDIGDAERNEPPQ